MHSPTFDILPFKQNFNYGVGWKIGRKVGKEVQKEDQKKVSYVSCLISFGDRKS